MLASLQVASMFCAVIASSSTLKTFLTVRPTRKILALMPTIRSSGSLSGGIALPIDWRIRNLRNEMRRVECGKAIEFILGFNDLSLVQGEQSLILSLASVTWTLR